jgi:hypothetical protein
VSAEVGGGDPVAEDDAGPAGGRSWSLVCALGVLYVVVVVDDVVNELDVALLDGVIKVAGGSDESSEVRITAKISTPTSSKAAAPAANRVPGRLNQCAASWS